MQNSTSSSNDSWNESLERTVLVFEQAWKAASIPSIDEFVARSQPEFRNRLILELASIDMEFRWQTSARGGAIVDSLGGQPSWQDYVQHATGIGQLGQIPPALVAEEYRIRQLWGDRPSHDRFMSEFPGQFVELPKLLASIDEELRADGAMGPSQHSVVVAPAPDPRAPLPWSDYLLEEHLGSGGFGKVYRATQRSLDRPVAVKALHKARQSDAQAVEQFIQEARLLAQLDFPGIVGVHGLGRFPAGGYFLVMDWIDGKDLQQRLAHEQLTIEEAVGITIAVARAIQYAHEHDVIHGDLKPSNILVNQRRDVYVTDFGLAHIIPTGKHREKARAQFQGGTVAYLAPEVVRESTISVAVDIYGLGALLYALLTGRPPREGDSVNSILAQLEAGISPTSPSSLRADIPSQLDAVIMKCLDSRIAARFDAAEDVAVALS